MLPELITTRGVYTEKGVEPVGGRALFSFYEQHTS